jgi:Fe-S cluster assembly iron-binding protein IscA
MLELTDSARQELVKYFSDKDKTPIRVYLSPGGCGGPRLALALDEQKDGDEVVTLEGGLTFLMEKELYTAAKPITVDATYAGFAVTSSLQFAGGGCGCSSGCGGSGDSGCGSSCAEGSGSSCC